MTSREMLGSLKGYKCVCKANKETMQSFCKKCYYSIPEKIRKKLYRGFGNGYEDAFRECLEHLKTVGRVS